MSLSPVAAVLNLKAALLLAGDHDLGVALAEFNLSNMTAGAINFLSDQSTALLTSGLFTSRHVPAPMNANGRQRGIEVRLKHASSPMVNYFAFASRFFTSSRRTIIARPHSNASL
jgi:hypothetical protein